AWASAARVGLSAARVSAAILTRLPSLAVNRHISRSPPSGVILIPLPVKYGTRVWATPPCSAHQAAAADLPCAAGAAAREPSAAWAVTAVVETRTRAESTRA